MPRQPLIPRDLLDLYPDWYTRWGHNGAVMQLRSKLLMKGDYPRDYFRDHYQAIIDRLAEEEEKLTEQKGEQ